VRLYRTRTWGLGSVMGEDSLLEQVTAAAEERQLSHNSLIAYRRSWLKIIAWAAAEGLVLETFPVDPMRARV
jgi:phage tail sheath gpL-like